MTIETKICGLTTVAAVDAAVVGGAAYVGFVFFPKSPRHIAPQAAGKLIARLPQAIIPVVLTVDADDETIAAFLRQAPARVIQAHGRETPERVAALKARFGLTVMKAVGIGGKADLETAHLYEKVADLLLLDAKPPKKGLPGGNGRTFDWSLLGGANWMRPWLLAGGLTPDNVEAAIKATGAHAVDVSSGVETQPGIKSTELIAAFLKETVAMN